MCLLAESMGPGRLLSSMKSPKKLFSSLPTGVCKLMVSWLKRWIRRTLAAARSTRRLRSISISLLSAQAFFNALTS